MTISRVMSVIQINNDGSFSWLLHVICSNFIVFALLLCPCLFLLLYGRWVGIDLNINIKLMIITIISIL